MKNNPKLRIWDCFAFSKWMGIRRISLLLLIFLSLQLYAEGVKGNENLKEENSSVMQPSNLEASNVLFQQDEKPIRGKVTDSAGEPIPGVTVTEPGSANGTITDVDGEFSLTISDDVESLMFTFVGMQSQEVVLNGKNFLQVTMQDDIIGLEEVVVVGYGTLERKEVTSAVETVTSKDFNSVGSSDPMELIQGKVAGLNITRTEGSNPNSSASIQLRGVTSLTGSISPLIVIDGIPGGSLDMVQPDDIESFNVLKDGSGAAIYGSRANAGVILITTKKGTVGEPRFNYSTYFKREFVDKKPDYLSVSEFRDLIDQGLVNSDQDFGASTDLYDELINESNLSQYHNFSASGGSKKSNYRASVFYSDANGIAKENGREEFGGRFNFNQKGLNDRLTFSMNVATNFNKANLLGGGTGDFEQAIQRNPTAPIYNEDGTFLETEAWNNYNPLSRLANRISERNQQTFTGDAKIEFQLFEDLSVLAFGAYERDNYNDRNYRSTEDWDQRPESEYQGMAYASKSNYLNWLETFESMLNYNKTFNKLHAITAIAGYSYQYETTETFEVNNNGFTTDGFKDWNLSAGSAINNTQLPRPGMDSFKEDNTLIAFFGRVNYAFNDKYFGQVSLRHEGSSRFGENHKWGNFPAVSAGWTISEEEFLNGVSAINELKLRVGYGVTGNQGIPNYQSLVTLGTGGVYPQNGVYYQTYGASRNPNPNLKWEEKAEWNFGVDFSLFNHVISGSLDVYDRETKNLLYSYNAQQPPYIHSSIYTNVGSIKNSGVELQLSAAVMQKDDFSWDIDLTASNQNNKLTELSNDVFQANWLEFYGLPSPGNLGAAIRLEEGGSVGNFYGKRFAGFTDDGKWLFYKEDGSTGTASEMNENDLTVIGNGVPKYQASLTNTLRYKNFDLTIFFRGKFGFDILNTKEMYFGNKKWLPNNLLRSAVTTHKELDDDPQYSDYYIEKGDFVKLDNLTLGYNFNFEEGSGFRNLRLYVTGRNILTFTGYSGLDPELQDTGFETGVDARGFYPRTQSWTIGLKLGF
jgi:TonB-dependent starch-binding outer membrane protein SusC